jgi:glycogen debranching enzyme
MPEEEGKQALAQEQESNKHAVITYTHASTTRSIANAILLKDQEIFCISMPDGQIPILPGHAYGLYYNDCRYLNTYELELGDTSPDSLIAIKNYLFQANFLLTNQEILLEGGECIEKQSLTICCDRLIESRHNAMHDSIVIHNFGRQQASLPLKIFLKAEFEAIFRVRGNISKRYGKILPPQWLHENTLYLGYEGGDGYSRVLQIHFSIPGKYNADQNYVEFELCLKPEEKITLEISMFVREEKRSVASIGVKPIPKVDRDAVYQEISQAYQTWKADLTTFETDHDLLNKVIYRSVEDLRQLTSSVDGYAYYAAGLPWFGVLFGRDSIWAAYQSLVYDAGMAESTLRILVRHQGRKIDEQSDEQPGKILHEYYTDELTRMQKLPYGPSYGSIDSTALFLILLGQHAYWTGRVDLFLELENNVERALNWIRDYGDTNADGLVDYEQVGKEPYNQGWKDSGNAVVDTDGQKVTLPIALIEVQGYVYAAKRLMASLYRKSGDRQHAQVLHREAAALKALVNEKYWMEDRGFYMMALHGKGLPVEVITSNPGQALWAGILERKRIPQVVKRLMEKDMFSGWGIRTLSTQEKAYNPIGYHLGTVWPFDNSLIAAGFKRYGFAEEARRVFDGMIAAATHFKDFQLPETFGGFSNEDYNQSAHYPVAAHPQAWSAAAVPMFLTTLLGLQPNAFQKKLSVIRPILPSGVNEIIVLRLKVGPDTVDLKFTSKNGGVAVETLRQSGDIRIEIC